MSGIIAQNSGRHTGLVKASSGGGGEWTLIQTLTSDGSDATISFTSGIDSTYDEYCFKFINIHPEDDQVGFTFNYSVDGGSNWNVTKTTTFFHSYHDEGDVHSNLQYKTDKDLAQGTGFQHLMHDCHNANDGSASGFLFIYNPSGTTFVKHYISTVNAMVQSSGNPYTYLAFSGGYGNTTSAVNAVQFKMSAGEIQGGSISLYGIG